jgi:hypothetical protein
VVGANTLKSKIYHQIKFTCRVDMKGCNPNKTFDELFDKTAANTLVFYTVLKDGKNVELFLILIFYS